MLRWWVPRCYRPCSALVSVDHLAVFGGKRCAATGEVDAGSGWPAGAGGHLGLFFWGAQPHHLFVFVVGAGVLWANRHTITPQCR